MVLIVRLPENMTTPEGMLFSTAVTLLALLVLKFGMSR